MEKTWEFPELLRLIDERSAAVGAVIAGAPDLGVPVPTCPDWTLRDLVQHLGDGRRKWAAIVAGDPAPTGGPAAPGDRAAVPAWLAASTEELLGALREAGPDRDCWTWWDRSESPQTTGAVARHQLQELAVHTYDAQLAVGAPQPLPVAIALDGVDEFLATCCAGDYRWPYQPAAVDYQATEGRSWRLSLTADGVRTAAPTSDVADACLRGTAGELVLALYGRVPIDSLQVDGDRGLFDRLLAWDPDES